MGCFEEYANCPLILSLSKDMSGQKEDGLSDLVDR
jgi:hypothetical protein